MSSYDNDYSDEMYDRYMLTGEGAEYFEEPSKEGDIEEIITEKVVEHKAINEQLDDVIRCLRQQIKEKESIRNLQSKSNNINDR